MEAKKGWGGEIIKRERRERAFWDALVTEFKIQVHDFNFPLFLSKAGRVAEGRLVVCWITAYKMSWSFPSQCLNDIMEMEMCRVSSHSLQLPLSRGKTPKHVLFTKFFLTSSPLFFRSHSQSLTPKCIQSHRQTKTLCVCKAAHKCCRWIIHFCCFYEVWFDNSLLYVTNKNADLSKYWCLLQCLNTVPNLFCLWASVPDVVGLLD